MHRREIFYIWLPLRVLRGRIATSVLQYIWHTCFYFFSRPEHRWKNQVARKSDFAYVASGCSDGSPKRRTLSERPGAEGAPSSSEVPTQALGMCRQRQRALYDRTPFSGTFYLVAECAQQSSPKRRVK